MRPRTPPGLPPPLPVARLPFASAWRRALWRSRWLVVAVCLGIATTTTVQALRPPAAPLTPVVVTARPVAAGTELADADVTTIEVPVNVAADESPGSVADVVGAVTAVPLGAGVPLVPGVLAGTLVHGPPGTVVAAVRLADPAVAGLLAPGMRVDVLAARLEGGDGTVVTSRALVLPVPGPAPGDGTDTGIGGLTDLGADAPAPVLLAVAPEEAVALAGAAASAQLSVVVVP